MAVFSDETTENDEILEKLKADFERDVMKSLLQFIESKKELGALYRDILVSYRLLDYVLSRGSGQMSKTVRMNLEGMCLRMEH